MVIQYDSIGKAMEKITRDINIKDVSLKNDLLGWVAEALDIMRTTYQLFPQTKEITIKNYGAILPCGIRSLDAVSYEGSRVRYGYSNNGSVDFQDTLPSRNYMKFWTVRPLEIVPNEYHQIGMTYIQASINQLEQVMTADVYRDLYYYTSGRELSTNIKEGIFNINYTGVALDKEDYPLVPRHTNLLEAVSNYVDYKLTRRGDKEGNWIPLLQLWETSANRAMNEIEFPSPERIQSLMDSTLGLIKPTYYEEFENL